MTTATSSARKGKKRKSDDNGSKSDVNSNSLCDDEFDSSDEPPPEAAGGSDDTLNDDSLSDAVLYFKSCSSQPKVRGNLPLQIALEKVEQVATETGLPGDDIITLVDVAVRGYFPDSVSTRLIKHLIPATVVPSTAVLKAISWMCTNKPSSNTQALLIRWIILIHEVIDKPNELRAMYGILFYFLQNEVMCKHVCHLLYLLTRKENVKLFRVQQLLKLQKKMGPQPYIQGLLSIYKVYCPRCITLQRSNKVFFRQTDKVWQARVRTVLDRQGIDHLVSNINTSLLIQPAKRSKPDLIPSKYSNNMISSSHEGATSPNMAASVSQSVPFVQIASFDQLLQNFDKLELPSQMAAALQDRNLQHVLMCYPDPVIATRIAHWLDHNLCQEFLLGPSKSQSHGEELLQSLVNFSAFLKEGVPVCENFLAQYLHIWNGTDYRPLVLQLVTRIRLHPYQYLNDMVLEPLRKLYFCSSVYFKCQVLKVLTSLLNNFVSVELPRHRYCIQRQQDEAYLTNSSNEANNHCVFEEEVEDFCVEETLLHYIEFTGSLIEVGLQVEGANPLLMHCVLNFYNLVCDLHDKYDQAYVVLPHHAVIYWSLFSDAIALSRMCHLICRYRESFLSLRNTKNSSLSATEQHTKEKSLLRIQYLNQYILDYCDSLWRHRAFSCKEPGTIYKLVSHRSAETSLLEKVFSLHRHPALLGFAVSFMDKNFDPRMRHHPASLWEFRDEFMSYLGMNNLCGISEFIAKNISRKSSMSPSLSQY